MARRQGASLVEVLVAIFVMGIGMIALLTLFPLGALRMAQAIQDDTCARAVANANSLASMTIVPPIPPPPALSIVNRPLRSDAHAITPPFPSPFAAFPALNRLPLDTFKDIPVPGYNRAFAADPNGVSYPVYIDPIGYSNSVPGSVALPSQYWLGTGGGNYNAMGLIARVPVSFVINAANPPPIPFTFINSAVYKWFSLLDDINFDTDPATGGITPPVSGPAPTPPFQRDIRYSWAYLVQRPRTSDPSVVNCSIVVYNKRPLALTGSLTLSEATYNAVYNLTKNTISVSWAGSTAPNIRTGGWVLDCTYVQIPPPPAVQKFGSAHGYFYRVVGITDTSPTSADLEVQQPLRGFPLPTAPNYSLTPPGMVMFLDGVAEVYERGLDRKFD